MSRDKNGYMDYSTAQQSTNVSFDKSHGILALAFMGITITGTFEEVQVSITW